MNFVKSHQRCFRWLSKNFDIQGVVIFRCKTIHKVCRVPEKLLQRSIADFLRRHHYLTSISVVLSHIPCKLQRDTARSTVLPFMRHVQGKSYCRLCHDRC